MPVIYREDFFVEPGSKGACPPNLVESAVSWFWSSHRERCSRGLAPQVPVPDKDQQLIVDLPITLPENWTEFVDTPLTAKELVQLKKKIERQSKVVG